MITKYEKQYMEILKDIYENGYEDGVNERTGLSTKRLPNMTIRVDLEKEFPILKSKQVFAKTAEREILWIWQRMSNDVHDLKAKIWDEWADEKGSIGKAYGYQMAKPVTINEGSLKNPVIRKYPNQPSMVLGHLKEFPNTRRACTNIWDVDELGEMNLTPCVFSTCWNLDGGRLNLMLTQRSGDMPYGVPFNTTQYAMLTCMFAKHLGVKPGIMLHTIADAHIYANQMEGVKRQLRLYELLGNIGSYPAIHDVELKQYAKGGYKEAFSTDDLMLIRKIAQEAYSSFPIFVIDEDVTSFWDMTVHNAKIVGYKFMDRVDFGTIAI